MKRTTKKLSGIGLELFLRRFYRSYSGIDDTLARRLSQDGAKTFASVRLRRMAWRDWRPNQDPVGGPDNNATNPPPERAAEPPAPAGQAPAAVPAPGALEQPAAPAATQISGDVPFDPYAIGLVPTYQREGADGLSAKLADITSLDNLRKTARSQQIALPAELRGDDADIEAVRTAIVSAVGKRIANRRAAAG